jgi:hypothetical protein
MSAEIETPAKSEDQTGHCTAKTSRGPCPCPAFVFLRRDQGYPICADCTHTQQIHALKESVS